MKILIVNEKDEVIGSTERNEKKPGEISRVSALWVSDKEGNVLLAQRSFSRKQAPGIWGPAVAGTVEEGETYESNVVKEAKEEIGLRDIKPILGPKIRRSTTHEYFVQWFTMIINHDYPFKKQDDEVEEIRWFSKDEIVKLYKEKPEMFSDNFNQYIEIFLK
jgi:isopentenyldiphosphate isomerase